MQKNLKIFHGLVNYGTQAGYFAKELRNQGFEALSVVSIDSSKREIDIEMLHGANYFSHRLYRLGNLFIKIYWFFKFNTFHFYYGTSLFPKQIDLPLYSFFNKKVIMEYLGWDVQLYQYSIDKYQITNAATYKSDSPEVQRKHDEKKLKRLQYESKYVDFQIVCSPKYSEFVPNSYLLPLAIDLDHFKFHPLILKDESLRIMHAPTSRGNKGSVHIIEAINRLKKDGFNIIFNLIENVTHKELMGKYVETDIFIDQILGGWYGTVSIEALATGRPTVCYLREEYYNYIDYGDQIPIINANPNTIYDVLRNIIKNKHKLPNISIESRRYVEKIHDVKILTKQLTDIYLNKVWHKNKK